MPWRCAGRPPEPDARARTAEPDARPALPQPASFRDVVALCSGRDPMLHSHLRHSVHLVRFAPGVIELRPEPDAPRDLAARLGALLLAATGARWTIALSTAPGEPTLGEQGQAADADRRAAAETIRWCARSWTPFPAPGSARYGTSALDAYGLRRPIALGEPDDARHRSPTRIRRYMEDDR